MTQVSIFGDQALASVNRQLARLGRQSRYFLIGCVSLALVLALQLIPHSHLFFGDDYIQLGAMEGVVQDFGSPPFRLYEFYDGSVERWQRQIERGPLPWFADPELKIRFFRPLSSGLLTLDHALFGRRTWGYRIQAIFWYLLLVVAYGHWVRRIIPLAPGAPARSTTAGRAWHPAAMLALLIFVVSDKHWLNVFWSAGRWVLVSTALTLLGCAFYASWRSDRWRPGLYLSVMMFIAGLLAGEVALAILAFPLAAEIFCTAASRAGRLKGLALLLILAIGYLAFYAVSGYGTHGSTLYLNPMDDPARYLARLPSRMLAMSGEVFLWIPGNWRSGPAGAAALALTAALLIPAFCSGSPDTRSRLLALLTGVAACMLPLAGGNPNTRNLMVPFIGAAALLAIGIHSWWQILQGRTWLRWVGVPLVASTCVINLGVAPYRWFTRPARYEANAIRGREYIRTAGLIDANAAHQRVVFLTGILGSSYGEYFYRRLEGLPLAECWWLLSTADAEHIYHRTQANRLELELEARELLIGSERMFRTRNTQIHAGDRIRLKGLEVEILGVGAVGATRIAFTFDRNLDDPSLVFLAGPYGFIERVTPPAIGESVRLRTPE